MGKRGPTLAYAILINVDNSEMLSQKYIFHNQTIIHLMICRQHSNAQNNSGKPHVMTYQHYHYTSVNLGLVHLLGNIYRAVQSHPGYEELLETTESSHLA